mmetsp:Transcript_7337/g.16629  ORF Transcript_7337/g.16629 Transcript_7337/m.16629 type:complete len:862 (-) Transcript_7337:1012-3597(-)
MTIVAPPSPRRPPPPPPPTRKSPRTPQPPPSPHRSPSRKKSEAMMLSMPMQPPFPATTGDAVSDTTIPVDSRSSSSRQIIAAPSRLNPQWQIAPTNNRNSPPYNRKHPPPPPPRPPPSLLTSSLTHPKSSSTNGGANKLAAAAHELTRAYSTGSSYSRAGSSGSGNRAAAAFDPPERRRSNSFSKDSKKSNSVGNRAAAAATESKGEIMAINNSNGNYNNYSLNNSNNNNSNINNANGNGANDNNQNATTDGDDYEENGGRVVQNEDQGDDEDEETSQNCIVRLFSALLCIFPKIEPLPWGTFCLLTIWSAIPPACFILFFTQMGFGEQIYYTIAIEMGHYSSAVALGLAIYIFLLYMLDADEWTSRCGSLFLDFSILAIVCGFVLLVLLIADRFPYGMVCLFAVFHPLWLLALKLMFYSEKGTRVFVSWLSGPLFFISVVVGVTWTAWVFSDPDNEWNIVANMVAAERTGCVPDYEGYPECRAEAGSEETCFSVEKSDGKETLFFPEGCEQSCTNVYNDCLNGFILWVGPVLVSMTTFFLSFFCTFLRTDGARADGAREKDVLNFGAIWIFILFAMWVTTSLAGTAAGVTAALAALTLASFIASAMFIAVSFSKEERSQNAAAVFERLREKYGNQLDVARGLFVVTCAPIVLVYFGFSIANQFVRRTLIFPCSQPPGEEGDIFTTRTRKQANVMKSWDRAKVYTYAIYWGIAFMILQVLVANLTVVFLSWMIEKTADLSLAAVTVIMCGVGVLMFLLPPVPGVPVYLTLGIVLPAQGHDVMGWPGAIMYSVGIGLLLKLFSSALQQKLIGQNLSHYVKVRQFVGVNSILMKAMRLVLSKGGLSVPKVTILIGGPGVYSLI